MSKYRIFLFYQQIGKAPAKGIVSWKLSRCRWICLCLDVIRQMSYMLKRFENRQNSPGGCFPKICTIYHYCKMYRKSFKRCQIIFFHKKLNARMQKTFKLLHSTLDLIYLSVFRTEILDLYKGGLSYRRTAGLESRP